VYGFLGSVNLFHGRMDEGQLRVGDETLPQSDSQFGHGTEVYAFARPHELEISVDPAVTSGIAACVRRVMAFGLNARIELDGTNGASGRHFEVELPQSRVRDLGLEQGRHVRLIPSKMKLFARPDQPEARPR